MQRGHLGRRAGPSPRASTSRRSAGGRRPTTAARWACSALYPRACVPPASQPPVAALAHKAESGTPVAHAHSGAGSERLSGARRMSPLLGGVPVIFCIVLYHRPPGHMLSWARPAPAPAGCWLWPCCRSLLFCASAILRRLALNLPLLWISPTAASRADETAPDFLLCSCAARFLSFTRPEYPLDISFFLCLVGALCRCISSHLLSIIASAPSASSRD